jgi:hypothetical protein
MFLKAVGASYSYGYEAFGSRLVSISEERLVREKS